MQDQRVGGEGKVMCSRNACTHADRDLARLLPAAVFVHYVESRQRLFEEWLAGENENMSNRG